MNPRLMFLESICLLMFLAGIFGMWWILTDSGAIRELRAWFKRRKAERVYRDWEPPPPPPPHTKPFFERRLQAARLASGLPDWEPDKPAK